MYELRTFSKISELGRAAFELVAPRGEPFLSYEWLDALENTGCVQAKTGWIPLHIGLYQRPEEAGRATAGQAAERLIAFAPAYVKFHTEGEFVFDQSWAKYSERYLNAAYYPKLVIAVPFTPASGQRVLTRAHNAAQLAEWLKVFSQATQQLCEQAELSGVHLLFPDEAQAEGLRGASSWVERHGVQYHWRNAGYADFSEFLQRFNSKRRNQILRERRGLEEQGLELQVCAGGDLDDERIEEVFQLYCRTVEKFFWGRQYLSREFFFEVFKRLPQAISVVRAVPKGSHYARGNALAMALNVVSERALFGRYWGSFEERPYLHFNVCYYRGIEYCIEQGLTRFEPGAGGEHKLARGFEPTPTPSFHWLKHPELHAVVSQACGEERGAIRRYIAQEGRVLR